jgi:splicing factor 3A subunit 3
LSSFAKRVQPLKDLETQQTDAENEFARKWDASELIEWQPSQKENGEAEGAGIWCAACVLSLLVASESSD